MPRFYLHIHDDMLAADLEGVVLPDGDAAMRAAVIGARSLAAEQVTQGWLNLSHWIDVTDEDGNPIGTITFEDAVEVGGYAAVPSRREEPDKHSSETGECHQAANACSSRDRLKGACVGETALEYCIRRANEEQAAAAASSDSVASDRHLELAALYEARARGLRADLLPGGR